ncbi:hypothetical protein MMC17_008950 [Xylographa soralifera]|nr:hypothetical protein [Xylographa soralifera]
MPAWVEEVNEAASSAGGDEQLPAMKLMGFFKDMALGSGESRKFLSGKTLALSPTLRDSGRPLTVQVLSRAFREAD